MITATEAQGWRSLARRWVSIALLFFGCTAYAADSVEVRKKARIYSEPDRHSEVIIAVDPTEHTKPLILKLVSNKNQNGYLNVIAPASDERGWIYKSFVRPYEGASGANKEHRETSLSRDTKSSEAFQPGCKLPFPLETERREIDGACGMEGSGKKKPLTVGGSLQNQAKNNLCGKGVPIDLERADFARLQDYVDNEIHLEYGHGKLPDDRDSLRKTKIKIKGKPVGEGSVVRYVGYVHHPRNSNVSNGETVNCNKSGAANNDIHIDIMKEPEDHVCSSVTVEIIPHFRPKLYNVSYLKELQDRPFRFTGQLFFDGAHMPCQSPTGPGENPKRISSWEIHPVYAVDVCKHRDIRKCKANDEKVWLAFHDAINEVSEEDD